MAVNVRRFASGDEARWRALWRAYLEFYNMDVPEAVTASTWRRILDPDGDISAFAAEDSGKVVGLAQYFFHPTTASAGPRCYLQDLFVDKAARGRGAARALMLAVYAEADKAGADQVYWLTAHDNLPARRLYDRIGQLTPMIKYRRVCAPR